MNAIELFHKDGKPAGVFYCEKCKIVSGVKSLAQQCCRPYKCTECGAECDMYYTICRKCQVKKRAAEELARFEKAEKIPAKSYGGVVYLEGISGDYGDGYHSSVESLLESCEDGDDEAPAYAWACKTPHFASIDINDILQRIEEDGDAYEDFDASTLDGIPALTAAIEAFNLANKDVVSYFLDYTRAIVFQKQVTKPVEQ